MTGLQIRAVRRKLNLTQTQFAALFGVHYVTACRWEKDQFCPTAYQLGLLHKFAEAARRPEAQRQVAKLIVTEGALAAVRLLLNLAAEPGLVG